PGGSLHRDAQPAGGRTGCEVSRRDISLAGEFVPGRASHHNNFFRTLGGRPTHSWSTRGVIFSSQPLHQPSRATPPVRVNGCSRCSPTAVVARRSSSSSAELQTNHHLEPLLSSIKAVNHLP